MQRPLAAPRSGMNAIHTVLRQGVVRLLALAVFVAPAGPAMADDARQQQLFVEIVTLTRELAATAATEMQKGGVKAKREQLLCRLLGKGEIRNWVGRVYDTGANGDGKGILAIEIVDGVQVKTWNNFLSDTFDRTLIEPGTALFDAAAQLREGQTVLFSGRFIRDGSDVTRCLREASMTLDGYLKEPEYIFKFSSISAE